MPFRTLERQRYFAQPGRDFAYPELRSLVYPHIGAFDMMIDTLLPLACSDIGKRWMFDGKKIEDRQFGNRLTCNL